MSLAVEKKDRRVVPRWRDFRTTVETGELDGGEQQAVSTVIKDGGYFQDKLLAWRDAPSIENAADLVASALVLGRHTEAADAAQFLLRPDSTATPAVKVVAELVAGPADRAGRIVLAELKDIDIEAGVVRLRIRALRSQLQDAPRNALLWVDLARAYSMLGQRDHAVRAMERALGLVRNNRFILRSAARLFVHLDESHRAHKLLVESQSTRFDPWLLAAEIAVAAVAERKPIFIKQGRDLLQSGRFSSLQTAELASAIATLEMIAGDTRKARRLFRESLIDPNDNSLAQAEWAATKIDGIDVAPELLSRPRSFEARACDDHRGGRWAAAIRETENWFLDEPFSSRPAAFGSYLSGVAEQNYRLSEEFARRGLRANPDDSLLLNNLTVALANQGQLEEARETFRQITDPANELRPTLLATEGLLKFRSGDINAGRQLYFEAVELAKRKGDRRLLALALAHLAREEVLEGTEAAEESLRVATEASTRIDLLEIPHMVNVLGKQFMSRRQHRE
jgi:tetratricopeptide (TPR) repeat protein